MYSEGMGSSVARKAIVPPAEGREAFPEANPGRRAMGRPANGAVRELSLVEIRFAPGDDRDWLLKVMGTPETYVKLRNCRPTDGSPTRASSDCWRSPVPPSGSRGSSESSGRGATCATWR